MYLLWSFKLVDAKLDIFLTKNKQFPMKKFYLNSIPIFLSARRPLIWKKILWICTLFYKNLPCLLSYKCYKRIHLHLTHLMVQTVRFLLKCTNYVPLNPCNEKKLLQNSSRCSSDDVWVKRSRTVGRSENLEGPVVNVAGIIKVIIEKSRNGRFLWHRKWDLGWIWAGWHYWKKNWGQLWATFEAVFSCFH